MNWIVVLIVILLYVHLFNAIANLYFDSGRSLGLHDLYRRFLPPVKISIEI